MRLKREQSHVGQDDDRSRCRCGFLIGFGLARALGTSETGQYALAAATTGLAASGVTLLMGWSL
jgi:hypothetical protein